MARPVCPACGDNFSVAKVSALARCQRSAPAAAQSACPSLAELLTPPPAPHTTGRLLVVAVVAGLLLCVVTTFTFIWLCVAVGIGVFAEIMDQWYRAQEDDEYQQAMARWSAAYYCGRHEVVFMVGESCTYAPTLFAQLLRERPTLTAVPTLEQQDSQTPADSLPPPQSSLRNRWAG
jgi:hypothetical protein